MKRLSRTGNDISKPDEAAGRFLGLRFTRIVGDGEFFLILWINLRRQVVVVHRSEFSFREQFIRFSELR
jgi:hypothetical protein